MPQTEHFKMVKMVSFMLYVFYHKEEKEKRSWQNFYANSVRRAVYRGQWCWGRLAALTGSSAESVTGGREERVQGHWPTHQ